MNSIEDKCQKKGVRLTDQRKTIAKVLSDSNMIDKETTKLFQDPRRNA